MKIEAVSIDIFHSELAQTPGLLLERFNDACAPRAKFIVSRVDVDGKYPMNSRFEGPPSSAKENGPNVIELNGTDTAPWIYPPNLEAQRIAVQLLSPLHIP